METKQNPLDLLPPKTAFWVGFATALLAIGTLGFIILGTCTMRGSCAFESATERDDVAPAAAVGTVTAPPAQAAAATTVAVSKIAAVDDTDHVRGDKDAEITIVEYSDFECPFCSRFHPTVQQVVEDYDGKVRWVYRHFPLSFHPEAENAAEASECAAEQGKFWEYGDALVENQDSLGDAYYGELAAELGLNVSQFDTCRSSDKYLDRVSADAREGAAAGVTGTPGSFVYRTDAKGTDTAIIIKGAQPASALSAAIDSLLK